MRNLILLSVCLLSFNGVFAQHVTEEQALQKARTFMQGQVTNHANGRKGTPAKAPAMRKVARPGAGDALYIFNAENDGGFVIVSADERTDEILGYSTEGNIAPEQMPEALTAWLGDCEKQIKGIQAGRVAAPAKVPTHSAVEPMITALWNQNAPYYYHCPKEGEDYYYTGCAATSLAMIMYYHSWPKDATTEIPAYDYDTGKHCDALQPIVFDWDSMTDTYDGTETGPSAEAVSWLMRYCGQALQMNYTTYESSAVMSAEALVNYFGYDSGARRLQASDYSIAEWDALIYHEMESSRPVWYGGAQGLGAGHAFVLDGYDGQGFYHVNWGWSGYCDGYYKITHMAPSGSGIGGGTAGVGYDLVQQAVVGIQPPTTTPNLYGSDVRGTVALNNTNVIVRCENNTSSSIVIDMGVRIEGRDDTDYTETITLMSSVEIGSGLSKSVSQSLVDLADGHYRISVLWRYSGETEWQQSINHICIRKENGTCEELPLNLDINIEVDGSLIAGEKQEIVVRVVNNGCEVFQQSLRLFVSKTSNKENKGRAIMFLEDGETETFTFNYIPYEGGGTYHIWLATDAKGENVVGQADMEIRELKYGPDLISFQEEYNYVDHELSLEIINSSSDKIYSRACSVNVWPCGKDVSSATVFDVGIINILPGESTTITLPSLELSLDNLYYCSVSYYRYQEDSPHSDKLITTSPSMVSPYYSNGFYVHSDGILSSLHFSIGIVDETEGNGCIRDIPNMKKVVVPHRVFDNSIKKWYTFKQLDTKVFQYEKLSTIELEEGFTCISAEFSEVGIKRFVIPSTLQFIGEQLFHNCTNLEAIYCKGSVPPKVVNSDGLSSNILYVYGSNYQDISSTYYDTVKLYVPTDCAEAYRNSPCWSRFTNIVEIDMDNLGDDEEPYTETCYLFNLASGKYLCAGNDWGTQASLDEFGLDMVLTQQADGRYTIDTRIGNGNDSRFLSMVDGTVFCDQPQSSWTIKSRGEGYFTLSPDDSHYLCYDGESSVLMLTEEEDEWSAYWQIYSKDEMKWNLQFASSDYPCDATFMLPGANFGRNDLRNNEWQGEPVLGGDAVNQCAEKYNTSFDVWQELTDVPNGFYKVRVQGFYREGADENSGIDPVIELRQNSGEHRYACLYANEANMPLKSIFDEAGRIGNEGLTTPWGNVPNTMGEASHCFSAGLYENELMVRVTDGTLRVGIKKTEAVDRDWAIFDNFRLTYYGQYLKGDVNGDGEINAQDASLIQQYVARKFGDDAEGFKSAAADVNGDGEVTAQDASLVQQYAARKISW